MTINRRMNMEKHTICLNGKLIEGDLVVTAPCSDYSGLIGRVLAIYYVGTKEHDEMTDNDTDDVLVDFTNNYSEKRIAEIEEQFRDLYDDDEKVFEELPIDSVVMAPSELIRIEPDSVNDRYMQILLDSDARTADWCFNQLLNFTNAQPKSTVYTVTVATRFDSEGSNEEKEFNTECSAYEYACEKYHELLEENIRYALNHDKWFLSIERSNGFSVCGELRGEEKTSCFAIHMTRYRWIKTEKTREG